MDKETQDNYGKSWNRISLSKFTLLFGLDLPGLIEENR